MRAGRPGKLSDGAGPGSQFVGDPEFSGHVEPCTVRTLLRICSICDVGPSDEPTTPIAVTDLSKKAAILPSPGLQPHILTCLRAANPRPRAEHQRATAQRAMNRCACASWWTWCEVVDDLTVECKPGIGGGPPKQRVDKPRS
jgi:hypothetical protein